MNARVNPAHPTGVVVIESRGYFTSFTPVTFSRFL